MTLVSIYEPPLLNRTPGKLTTDGSPSLSSTPSTPAAMPSSPQLSPTSSSSASSLPALTSLAPASHPVPVPSSLIHQSPSPSSLPSLTSPLSLPPTIPPSSPPISSPLPFLVSPASCPISSPSSLPNTEAPSRVTTPRASLPSLPTRSSLPSLTPRSSLPTPSPLSLPNPDSSPPPESQASVPDAPPSSLQNPSQLPVSSSLPDSQSSLPNPSSKPSSPSASQSSLPASPKYTPPLDSSPLHSPTSPTSPTASTTLPPPSLPIPASEASLPTTSQQSSAPASSEEKSTAESSEKKEKKKKGVKLKGLAGKTLQLVDMLTSIKTMLEEHTEEMEEFDDILGEIEHAQKSLAKSLGGGQLIWKIENFSSKLLQAHKGEKPTIFSPAFETHSCGYSMALSLCPDGDGDGKGEYLSVYFCLLKGQWDAVLPWPFCSPITFTLLDQSDSSTVYDVSAKFTPNPIRENAPFLGRPTKTRNPSLGFSQFVHHTVLMGDDGGQFMKDDTIFIKVHVDVSNVTI